MQSHPRPILIYMCYGGGICVQAPSANIFASFFYVCDVTFGRLEPLNCKNSLKPVIWLNNSERKVKEKNMVTFC